MKLVTVKEMKQLERAADEGGHSYAAMMESAGRAVAEAIQQRIKVKDKRLLVLVGPGNNGGDGLVAAQYLCKAGAQTVCYLWKPRPKDDPNTKRVKELNLHCLYSENDDSGKTLQKALQNADVVIDALLGTGASRPIEGQLKAILETVREIVYERRAPRGNRWPPLVPSDLSKPSPPAIPIPYIVAVDVPSGLDCDTGAVDPSTLSADLTVTFAAAKHGQFRFPGAEVIGELVVADIGIAPELGNGIQTKVATVASISKILPERPLSAHKGTFGKAMIVAGSINYTGAPYLAAAAAARVGTGLVTLAPPEPLYSVLATKLSEATFILLPHNMGVFAPQAVKVLIPKLAGYAALLLGPGLGREKETIAFVHQLLGITESSQRRRIGFQPSEESAIEKTALPSLVIDADGLNALAEAEQWWTYLPENSILTPHPGEMTRLIKADKNIVAEDRVSVAREQASKWKQIVVLKGAYTVIAAPDDRATVIPFANPGLATAGTGDVLAGAIVGLLAQGLEPFDAAICGAYLHGLAGQIVAGQMGNAGMLASDLLPVLPQAIAELNPCC
jgi:NAD(P)H-hydrate epimerase